MLSTKLKEAAGNSADATLYVDDVFSTYLYTGTGAALTINNGIDLTGKGGLVWCKARSAAENNFVFDTLRGATERLITNGTQSQYTAPDSLTAFSSTGFTLGSGATINQNGVTNVSWTFRKAAKFFDVVTYTGNGEVQNIVHSLGVAPGLIVIKKTSATGNWKVYHRSQGSSKFAFLNSTDAFSAASEYIWNNTEPTSSVFTVGSPNGADGDVNASGGTYVAYLFAHDTSSTGIIQCGSYTGNGSATGSTISLGWEPQYLMVKNASGTGNWQLLDSMRGMPVGSADATLQANLSSAESSVEYLSPTATGFQLTSTSSEVNTSGSTYIYMAIRRPNKPPTSGTQVFSPLLSTGTTGQQRNTGFVVDSQWFKYRPSAGLNTYAFDRLRGISTNTTESGRALYENRTDAEANDAATLYFNNTGFQQASGFANANDYIYWNFKRAPGFFDEVCYTGTGSAGQSISHNLTVAPELILLKRRNGASDWNVGVKFTAIGYANLNLNNTDPENTYSYPGNFYGLPTATVFTLNNYVNINGAGNTFVAYLFATLAGISKVGSYTGNGGTQNIECGFATGARFVLIKRTDSTGDWYVWDSARGIVSANDPHLSLNTTAAEVTTDDSVDPYSAGFAVNQVAATNINVSSATYIFLAIA